jgi:hypothetical protein
VVFSGVVRTVRRIRDDTVVCDDLSVVPQTAFQIGTMLLLVVPGFVYTGGRRHLRGGATADEKDFSVRLVHGIAASVILDCLYLITIGPCLINVVTGTRSDDNLGVLSERPQLVGGVIVTLAVVIPAVLAAMVTWASSWNWVVNCTSRLPFSPTPSAWDHIAPKRLNCFVRVRTADGRWVGGYVSDQTYFSTYPEPRDLFIPEQWQMGSDGSFIAPIKDSLGVFVPLSGTERVSWCREPGQPEPSPPEPDGGRRGGGGGGSA